MGGISLQPEKFVKLKTWMKNIDVDWTLKSYIWTSSCDGVGERVANYSSDELKLSFFTGVGAWIRHPIDSSTVRHSCCGQKGAMRVSYSPQIKRQLIALFLASKTWEIYILYINIFCIYFSYPPQREECNKLFKNP